jgi:hypothetical protein
MEDADFKREFLDRAAIYMGDFLNERGTREIWDAMYEQVKTEYPYHRELINRWWPNYGEELSKARTWLSQRTDHFYKHLANYYHWGTPTPLTINKQEELDVRMTVNGIALTNRVFDGKYYAGRTLTINGQAPEGREVRAWRVTGAVNQEVQGSELTLQMPNGAIAINPVVGDASGIETIQPADTGQQPSALYDLLGNRVTAPKKGRIYIRDGKKISYRQ